MTKMLNKGFVLVFMVFAGWGMMSCTKLEEPYATAKHGNIKDTVYDWDTVALVKKVMLEDYTGHKCTNCPEAAITARSLEELYQGKLLVVAVHAGFYATPGTGDYALDLRAEASEAWNTDFKVVSYPSGMVNRKDFGNGAVTGPDKWGENVAQVINNAPDAQLLILNVYDTTTRTLDITVLSHFINILPGSYYLTVCILESDIHGAQKNNNPNVGPVPDWFDYVFNDVMRGSVNGTYGEVLTTEVNTTLSQIGRFRTVLDAGWVAANCDVLAFISKSDTKEIVQAEIHPVIP